MYMCKDGYHAVDIKVLKRANLHNILVIYTTLQTEMFTGVLIYNRSRVACTHMCNDGFHGDACLCRLNLSQGTVVPCI